MKKKLISILYILIMTLLLSCSGYDNTEYKCVVIDISNNVSGLSIVQESNLWNEKADVSKTATSVISIKFDDVDYTGYYTDSVVKMYNSTSYDHYICKNGIEFGLNSKSKELAYIKFLRREFYDTEPYLDDVNDPEVYCEQIANQYASRFISVSDYKLIKSNPRVNNYTRDEKDYLITYYTYNYVRCINDIDTADFIKITVTSKGHLASLYMGSVGAFENIEFSSEACNEAIDKKLDALFGTDLVSYNIYNQVLAYSEDGDLVLCSRIKVQLQNGKESALELAVLL